MQLEDIFLAKFADLTPDGLFTVVGGGMNRINTDEFPLRWDLLFVLVRVRLTTEEALAQHTTALERESPNGLIEPIAADSPMLELPGTAEAGPDGKVGLRFALRLANMVFPNPGVYKYRFKIDGREIGAAELLIAATAAGEQAP